MTMEVAMNASIAARRLSEAIGEATKSSKFYVAGCLPVVDPGIEVDGLGAVKLPLKGAVAKKLVAQCHVAPYGKGTQTLVDRKVRNTLELDPKQFRLAEEWNSAVGAAAVRRKLTSATAKQPAPPADWARQANVACTCQYCGQLNAFLADPAIEVGRIPAREEMRQHLIGMIGRHQCDVN